MSAYTSDNIHIQTHSEAADAFEWVRADDLAEQHRKPLAWVERGLEACRRAGVPSEYFVRRYLRCEPGALKNDAVDFHSREIQMRLPTGEITA